MIKVILWDVDGTLLDFEKAEYDAMQTCFQAFGLGQCTDDMLKRYIAVNKGYWEMLERGEITKERLLVKRFEEFFAAEGLDAAGCEEAFNERYQMELGNASAFCDGAWELVTRLKEAGQVKQYAVTNGTKVAQDGKLRKSGLIDIFDDIFISEVVGVEKPGIGFFNHVWSVIGHYEPSEVVIVGDSLTSDMQGGNNAGIPCCWYNPKGLTNTKGLRIDWEISHLHQLMDILKKDILNINMK